MGSRNPGATNVLRVGGKTPALLTLFGDLLKGFIPVYLVKLVNFPPLIIAFVAIAAFIGHLYPVYFRFEGGKGVATAWGCLLALAWPAGVSWLFVWIAVALLFRYVSLASMIATLLAPAYLWFFKQPFAYILGFFIVALVMIYRHLENMRRILQGTEKKISQKR